MGDQNNDDWGVPGLKGRSGFFASSLAACLCALEAESERWFLWLPVFFGDGILAYFALWSEPDARVAAALVLAAAGLCLTWRNVPLGFALSLAFLAFALGFANVKLRSEMVRAPVLAEELRYVPLSGWVETHERHDEGRARILLRVIALGDLAADQRQYRVRVTLPMTGSIGIKTGEAVQLRATLRPPPSICCCPTPRYRRSVRGS